MWDKILVMSKKLCVVVNFHVSFLGNHQIFLNSVKSFWTFMIQTSKYILTSKIWDFDLDPPPCPLKSCIATECSALYRKKVGNFAICPVGKMVKSQILLVRMYFEVWIMKVQKLFTEVKNIRWLPRIDTSKLTTRCSFLAICMEKYPKTSRHEWTSRF